MMSVTHIPDFWLRMRSLPRKFLALDYDGTLAPFHVDPLQAYPLTGIIDALHAIHRLPDTTLLVVSGRPVAEVLELLGDLGIAVIGSHGFELKRPDGRLLVRKPNPLQATGLSLARALAGRQGPAEKLEIKVASVALHTRGMAEDCAAELEARIFAAWSELSGSHQLECRRFNGGVELRCTGRDKGDALYDFLEDQGQPTFCVYVGDDETDEDAFRMLRSRVLGIGIKVGDAAAATAAHGYLQDCGAVRSFLETWVSEAAFAGA